MKLASRPVITAFAALRRALDDIGSAEDRALLRDAVRDALDRDAASVRTDIPRTDTQIVANSWTVTGEIHHGAHFVVERLRHRDLGGSFALKRIRAAFAHDPLFRQTLLREAANHLRVRHRAVLHAHAVLRLEDGSPALLLEYRQGPSLAAHLAETVLPPRDILQLTSQICEALGEVHSLGIIHGDVTPANILLPEREPARALLCDFGLSSLTGQGIEGFDALGTPGFVAPEAEMPDRARHAGIDIFGLGAVISACLDALHPEICAPLQRLAESLCTADRAERPQTVAAVQQRIETTASEL